MIHVIGLCWSGWIYKSMLKHAGIRGTSRRGWNNACNSTERSIRRDAGQSRRGSCRASAANRADREGFRFLRVEGETKGFRSSHDLHWCYMRAAVLNLGAGCNRIFFDGTSCHTHTLPERLQNAMDILHTDDAALGSALCALPVPNRLLHQPGNIGPA